MYYPCHNNLYKTFIKVAKTSRLLLYGYCFKKDVPKQTYMRSIRSSGWGIVFFCRPGGRRQTTKKEKIATPRGYARGGMVTGQDEHPAKTDS